MKQYPFFIRTNLPRKLKKKLFGTQNMPKYFFDIDHGQGEDITIEALVFYEKGKVRVAEIWQREEKE